MRIAVLVERLAEMIRKMAVQPSVHLKPHTVQLEGRLVKVSVCQICICGGYELQIYM